MKISEFFKFLPAATRLKLLKIDTLQRPSQDTLPVIVSLTSIPSRLAMLHFGIRSLMAQSHTPEKIVLWLHESLKDAIPLNLIRLTGDVFEIRYSPYTCSHRKLIHSLGSFPGSIIVTCDDDHIYPVNWLKLLYDDHLNFPLDIVANRCRYISYDSNGNTHPYKQWTTKVPYGTASQALMPVGYGGVLYPPNVLHQDTTKSDLFLKLAPMADDLWFKAMSFLNGTNCRKASTECGVLHPVPGTRRVRLAKKNVNQDMNRKQWDDIRKHYDFKTPDADSCG